MRYQFVWCFAVVLGITQPAVAGELSFVDGHTIWRSTQCQEPAVPPLLSGIGSEAAANDVNIRITQYNQYVQQSQDYMNCISQEAQRDAGAASQAITATGQSIINATQNNVVRLKQSLQSKQ